MSADDEFYIGYEGRLPPSHRRCLGVAVTLASVVVAIVAVIVTASARPLAPASFDFGRRQSWTGWLVHTPAPAILVPIRQGGYRRYWLVGRGKRGAETTIASIREGWATIGGTLISRDAWRMIEVAAAAPSAPPAAAPPLTRADRGSGGEALIVRGEIVDSKCFLGVMNPGERVVHRDCAVRCLSGGVPPMLAYAGGDGRTELAVLVDADGRPLHGELLHAAGRTVTAGGRLFTINGQPVFQLASIDGRER